MNKLLELVLEATNKGITIQFSNTFVQNLPFLKIRVYTFIKQEMFGALATFSLSEPKDILEEQIVKYIGISLDQLERQKNA